MEPTKVGISKARISYSRVPIFRSTMLKLWDQSSHALILWLTGEFGWILLRPEVVSVRKLIVGRSPVSLRQETVPHQKLLWKEGQKHRKSWKNDKKWLVFDCHVSFLGCGESWFSIIRHLLAPLSAFQSFLIHELILLIIILIDQWKPSWFGFSARMRDSTTFIYLL